jgi:uncharacterized lipoprotein YmbA
MIRARTLNLGVALLALVVGACSSVPPVRYFTLVPAPSTEAAVAPVAQPFQFELLPVTVPAQVDQPQLVVRQGGQGVAMLQGQRWIAPLGDEVRGALSADLTRDFHAQDVTSLPAQLRFGAWRQRVSRGRLERAIAQGRGTVGLQQPHQ